MCRLYDQLAKLSTKLGCLFSLFNQLVCQVKSHHGRDHGDHAFLSCELHDLIFQGLHGVRSGKEVVFWYGIGHDVSFNGYASGRSGLGGWCQPRDLQWCSLSV